MAVKNRYGRENLVWTTFLIFVVVGGMALKKVIEWSPRYAGEIPNMAGLLGNRFHQEALDLLGDARFRTIRQHCLMYESLKKKDFTAIPWRESDVRQLLNRLRDEEVTPYKIQQVWDTIRWFSKKFGILDPQECVRLNKKAYLEEELVETTTKPQRKAAVPSKEVLWALEEGATQEGAGAKGPGTPHGGPTDRHACSLLRR